MRQESTNPGDQLKRYYTHLLTELGPQGWWPGRTRLEVILGAILTQNTAWANAERAVRQLRRNGLLNLQRLRATPVAILAGHIRSAGFYRQKARTIHTFVKWLGERYGGSLQAMFADPTTELRDELLQLRGLGSETVDSILLYAGRQPFFVADAYARRILGRHGLAPAGISYAELQEFMHAHLPADQALFNEFHALLVEVGKRWCKRREPRCQDCALQTFLPKGTPAVDLADAKKTRTILRPAPLLTR